MFGVGFFTLLSWIWAGHRLNYIIGGLVCTGGGQGIPHPSIQFGLQHLRQLDGVHLSDKGSNIFLADLQADGKWEVSVLSQG